jgi:hypothetical protein
VADEIDGCYGESWVVKVVLVYPTFHVRLGGKRAAQSAEYMGSKEKVWLRNSRNGRLVMLKLARPRSGEDWSEKVAFEIARRLGIPCPRVDLAKLGERYGVFCWDFLRRNQPQLGGRHQLSLIHGNELLLRRDSTYPTGSSYHVSRHTVGAVMTALQGHGHRVRPGVLSASESDAFSAFVGYLMLDALIGNTDRHHENWGVITQSSTSGTLTWLAPSYDHASSLGRELDDDKRKRRLDGSGRGTVADYADRAVSAFWADSGEQKLSTLEAFEVAGRQRPSALSAWLDRLSVLQPEFLSGAVELVPESRLSATGKRFTQEVLRYNRQRLLALRDRLRP